MATKVWPKIITVILTLLLLPLSAAAARDRNDNAVIFGGFATKKELLSLLANGDGRHSSGELGLIFESHGITAETLQASQEGSVNKKGEVFIGSRKIAANALSMGRSFMPGSTKVIVGNTTLWMRPPSTSFRSNSLEALVFAPKGQFEWAVIKSCGNIVTAKALFIPTPTPKPTATPAPILKITPTPTPVVTPVPQKPLPTAGSGLDVLISTSIVFGSAYLYRKSRAKVSHALLLR